MTVLEHMKRQPGSMKRRRIHYHKIKVLAGSTVNVVAGTSLDCLRSRKFIKKLDSLATMLVLSSPVKHAEGSPNAPKRPTCIEVAWVRQFGEK